MAGEKLVRRFPTPIPGLPKSEAHYEAILSVLYELSNPPTREEFNNTCQAVINELQEDPISESWAAHITSDLIRSGFIREERLAEVDETKRLIVDRDSEEWLKGNIPFEECIFRALKRGWVLKAQHPEGFEALERILHALTYEPIEPASSNTLKSTLQDEYNYQFSQQGIRGYPRLLCLMGYLEETADGYVIPEDVDPENALGRFRDADIFRKYQNFLRREGALVEGWPPKTAKRALMKYYMYREAGGWSKRKQWYRQFHKHYLSKSAQAGDNLEPDLKRKEKAKKAEDRPERLRKDITDNSSIDSERLYDLPMSELQRVKEAAIDEDGNPNQVLVQSGSGDTRADLMELVDGPAYSFPDDFSLYDWQEEAAEKWFSGTPDTVPEAGIAEVVTGAGKTVMGLEVIRRWLDSYDHGVVTIVVPTRVLMYQWLSELTEKLNVPIDELGWAGDGHRDAFGDNDGQLRVLVTIVNTAVKNDYLERCLADVDNPPHLLVADECHNYTGEVHSNVLEYHNTATLGLSATPTEKPHSERDYTSEEQMLFDLLGEPFYTLTYSEGIERNLIPSFSIKYIGFELSPQERQAYDGLTREISDQLKDIRARYTNQLYQLNGNLHQKLNTILNSDDAEHPAIGQFFTLTQERRELVQNAVQRQAITLKLLSEVDSDEKAIVFQERIEQLKQLIAPHELLGQTRERTVSENANEYRSQLYVEYPELEEVDKEMEKLFEKSDYWPVMYHSGHRSEIWNDFAMEWFRADNHANVMLSVKALIEGVDVPDADIGIIRVSSGSVRQRIQTLGRILRTGDDPEAHSTLYILYARNTVDENIFREYDWDEQLGNAELEHLQWVPGKTFLEGTMEAGEPPEVDNYEEPDYPDLEELTPGDVYEGPRRGYKISVDAQGKPFEKSSNGRRYIINDEIQEAAEIVYRRKGGGSIIINDAGHLITFIDGTALYVGNTDGPETFEYDSDSERSLTDEPPDFDDLFGDS